MSTAGLFQGPEVQDPESTDPKPSTICCMDQEFKTLKKKNKMLEQFVVINHPI